MMLFCMVVITIFLPKHPRFRFEFERGKVWMHDDLISPYNLAILKTQTEIDKARTAILESINPVYDLRSIVATVQLARIINDFEAKWKIAEFDEDAEPAYEQFSARKSTRLNSS